MFWIGWHDKHLHGDQFSSQSLYLYCDNAKPLAALPNDAKEMSVVDAGDMPDSLTISVAMNER